ncbi:MAG: Hsp33 family molecular chaperone HslO [Desulfobacteraceae bacterium]|nr:Hsp33 family molecular chaperone HslO [Desulfobacteraceae bacterium]
MIKKQQYGNTLKEKLTASLKDRFYNFVLADKTIRGVILNGTRMVNEMRWNHELGILETMVLGQAYLGAALMSADLKKNGRLSLQVECSGPIKGLHVESNAYGEVRGYLKNVPIPINTPLESVDFSSFYGAGFLSVARYLEDAKQPFIGKVMMDHGCLAKDLANYHQQSEQIQTAFVLSVSFDKKADVDGAGGLFLQAMPGADERDLERIESILVKMPSLGKNLHGQDFPNDWLNEVLGDFKPKVLGYRGIEFMCHCNREYISNMLKMLEKAELDDMSKNGPFPLSIRCHNCNTSYDFSKNEIQAFCNDRN